MRRPSGQNPWCSNNMVKAALLDPSQFSFQIFCGLIILFNWFAICLHQYLAVLVLFSNFLFTYLGRALEAVCNSYLENKCVPAHIFMNLSCSENCSVLSHLLLLLLKFIKPILESLHSHTTINLANTIYGFVDHFGGENKCHRAAGETHLIP